MPSRLIGEFADAGVEEIIFAPLRDAETVQRVDRGDRRRLRLGAEPRIPIFAKLARS